MKHLKLFFALFAMLALGVSNAWAETASFSYTHLKGQGASGSGADFTGATIDNIFMSGKGNGNNSYTQIYANGYLTFTPTNATITKIVLTASTASYAKTWSASSGSVSVSDKVITWTGTSDTEVKLTNTATAQARIVSMEVTYTPSAGGDEPPTPTTTYTIKWHTDKGVTTDVTLNEGATITKPETDPAMTGYEFMGWTTSCDVASDGSDFTALTDFGTADSDKDFYAVFAKATTTGGGGSTTGSKTLVSYSGSSYYTDGAITGVTGTNSASWTADAFTMVQNKNSGTAVSLTYAEIRVYASHSIVFTPSTGSTITSIVATATTTGYATALGGSSIANCTKDVSGSTVTITPTNGTEAITITNSAQSRLKTIVVNYTTSGGGTTTYDNYITTCASGIEYIELGDDFKWSAAEAEVTIDATDNVFPELTNTHNVPVKYSSSDDAIATIADGTVTLKKEGTVTITAKYEGGTSAGTGKEYKAKTVTYSLKVNKAVAQPTGTMYVKVTDAVTDGEYLIVYEAGNVAFDGSLTTLDAEGNMIEVQISSNTITGNTEIDAATFTIASMEGGHSIQSKSGKYIGRTSGSNGMNTGNSAIANVITFSNGAVKVAGSGSGASASLQYYAQSGSERFRYYTSSQKSIALYKKVDPNAVVEPVFTLAAGEYYGTQSVTISCATAGAEVYYTLDGTDPTSTSTKYTGAISIASTTTIKAVAIKGENSSAVVSATYTILTPLATMQEIFDKATAVGGIATPIHITMNNWVVTGVKNSNVYVTDGTKGLIIYTASHGFNVGDILSGTVACKVQLYSGSSELTELTSTTEGLTVTTAGVVTPVVVNDVTTLGGVNTGSVIKITGPCTVDGTKYYVAGVQLYNSLYTYTNPEEGYNYECTGVYLQYNTTKEILPRKAEDLVKIETQQPAGIKFETTEYTANVNEAFTAPTLTNPNGLIVTYSTSDATLATVNTNTGAVTIGNKTGKVTITASFAGNEDYVAATASYNITISDPNQLEATFVAGTDKSDTKSISKNGITVEFTNGVFNRADNYRCYGKESMTISYADGNITKIVIECTANDGAEYGPGQFTTETATYSYSGKVGTWTGEANSVTFTADKQVRMTTITVYYKQDNRAEAGLAWNPATVSLTVGDAFTAPTLSNPNGLTLTCTSDNENLATVTNAGVVTLKSGVTGKATITAKFDGNGDYKDATVTCTITVNPKTETVVILAQYNGQWYALKNVEETAGKVLAALPVNYVGGKLYNVEEADKATIEWQRAAVTNGIIFKNGENYIYGTAGSTDLKLSTTECAWTLDGSTYKIGNRTFIYRAQANGFKNYNATTTPGTDDYSNLPVVTAPVYATGDAYSRSTTAGKFGTICLPFGSTNYTGATFYEFVGSETGKVYLGSVTTLVAGTPYIFLASATEVAVYGNGTTAATPGSKNGLVGTFTNDTEVAIGNYILKDNALCQAEAICWVNAYRAYIVMEDVPTGVPTQMPGRRYISMDAKGENTTTGLDNITNGENTTIKVIVNGQLIIIRNGEKFNAQGQRL
ncbi:MAG: chitobiase/beta-hexosaminidase C-terminal domain-containing protein [Paludibacteraceae bacterium]|nr:chitobiase/beta-hexosaminidase C-terminal domain-containing protein [Paludibacteraceae bacterium]